MLKNYFDFFQTENDETKELGTTPCKGTVTSLKMSAISKRSYFGLGKQ
jgi:hypothetical protein